MWTKLRIKIQKRLVFYRLQKSQHRTPTFRDLFKFLQTYNHKKQITLSRKISFVVIVVVLLSTGQLNFMNLVTQANYSIDSEYLDFEGIYLDKPMSSHGEIATETSDYIVQPGDTIGKLTEKFQISASTITNANNLRLDATLEVGQKLKILPVTGLLHTVARNDSIAKISDIYQVPGELILYQNHITSDKDLKVGDVLIIPNGAPPAPATKVVPKKSTTATISKNGGVGAAPTSKAPETGGTFTWPASCRVITRGFNPAIPHWGLDCANKQGTPIYAASGGTVTKVSVGTWGGGYGNHVIIDHGNGITTVYAHLYKVGVSVGNKVSRGEGIGLMGTTGNSTGPHLHFEVLVNGKKTNPMKYL